MSPVALGLSALTSPTEGVKAYELGVSSLQKSSEAEQLKVAHSLFTPLLFALRTYPTPLFMLMSAEMVGYIAREAELEELAGFMMVGEEGLVDRL